MSTEFDNFSHIAETVSYQMAVYFPPHITIVSALPGET